MKIRARLAIAVAMIMLTIAVQARQTTQVIQSSPVPAPAAAAAQAGNLAFEVASVKPNKTGDNRVSIGIQPGGRYNASNVPLRQLIVQAYALQSQQLVGGPPWMTTDRFDISAKAPDGVMPAPGAPQPAPAGFPGGAMAGGPTPIQQMIRSLLADRFKLVVHTESRELQVYALMTTKADKTLGPKMTVSTTDCAALFARGRAGGPPPPAPSPNDPMTCGMRMNSGGLSAGDVTTAQLAQSLSGSVQRIVLDRTGLTGRYNLNLSWTPEGMPQAPAGVASPNAPPVPAVDSGGASIFTALQEQLGLKLESVRAPIDVIVIDSVEPPIPD